MGSLFYKDPQSRPSLSSIPISGAFISYCEKFLEISVTAFTNSFVFNSPDKVTELAGYKEMCNYLCGAGDLVPSVECLSGVEVRVTMVI